MSTGGETIFHATGAASDWAGGRAGGRAMTRAGGWNSRARRGQLQENRPLHQSSSRALAAGQSEFVGDPDFSSWEVQWPCQDGQPGTLRQPARETKPPRPRVWRLSRLHIASTLLPGEPLLCPLSSPLSVPGSAVDRLSRNIYPPASADPQTTTPNITPRSQFTTTTTTTTTATTTKDMSAHS